MNIYSKYRCNIFIAAVFFIILHIPVNAKVINNVTGLVVDAETSQTIPNAVIHIAELDYFITTKADGSFELKDIEEGIYTFEVTHLAYRENVVQLRIDETQKQSIIIYLTPKSIEINQVVVSDHQTISKFDDLREASNVLKGKELQKDLGQTLAATLKNETGLAIRSMGPAPARPVIRGLGGDRVHISEDGNKTTDLSATSPDHAVTIEPFSVDRIEVLRGPKVLTKTPTTIGGVVNVVRNEIPNALHDHTFGTIGAYGETANSGYLGSAVIETPVSPFAFRGEISRKKTSDLDTPVGKLDNSYSENLNYSIGGSYFPEFGFIGASFRRFELDYGVPGGFVGAHPNGVDIEMFRRQYNVRTKINIDTKLIDNIDIHANRTLYRHKEFESSGRLGSEFRILSHLGYANIHHKKLGMFDSGIIGISAEHRDFDIGGFVFTSPTNSFNIAGYFFETVTANKFSFELGGRVSYDDIEPENEKPNADIGYVRKRTFTTFSASVSAMYELSEVVYMGINVSKSSRVPTIEELYSEGPHLAAYSYEVGNPDLDAESGYGFEYFVYHKFDDMFFNINFFFNTLDSYIIPRNTGETNFQTFLPIYKTFGVGAQLFGVESQIDWDLSRRFSVSTSLSYTQGRFKGTGDPLPQIPPLKGTLGLKYMNEQFALGVETEFAAKQDRVDQFEEPTAGYMVFNTFAQYSFQTDLFVHSISLNFDNILNTEYRNHLSRVKSILPEAGRNLRLTYKVFFDIE